MRPEAIFQPMSVLAMWTGVVLLLTGVRRAVAVRAGRVAAHAFRAGDAPGVPADLTVFNRNLMNLLEMPVLFYVVCLAVYVTHAVDATAIMLAWAYVGLRLSHSAVHLTFNRVNARFRL